MKTKGFEKLEDFVFEKMENKVMKSVLGGASNCGTTSTSSSGPDADIDGGGTISDQDDDIIVAVPPTRKFTPPGGGTFKGN